MAIGALNVGNPTNLTATANIVPRDGAMLGFYVSSTTVGTITFYDSATTTITVPITGMITPVIGWQALPVTFRNGLYAVIGGTGNFTVVTV